MQSPIDLPHLHFQGFPFDNVDGHSIVHQDFHNGSSQYGGTTTRVRDRSSYSNKHTMISPPETTISKHTFPPAEYSNRPVKRARPTTNTLIAAQELRNNASPEYWDEQEPQSVEDSEEERKLEKRRRNTMAARRFRQRKQDHVVDLQEKLADVTRERDELRLKLAKWEGEVMALRKLLSDRRRK